MNKYSDISFPGNNSAFIRYSLLPDDKCVEEDINLICEAVGCNQKAAFLVCVKAGQSQIPIKLCKKCLHDIFAGDQSISYTNISSKRDKYDLKKEYGSDTSCHRDFCDKIKS